MGKQYQEKEIILNSMGTEAKKQFDVISATLDKLENCFNSQMDDSSLIKIMGSLLVTVLWGAAIWFFRKHWPYSIPKQLLTVMLVNLGLLIVFMLINDFVRLFYYGRIDKNKERVSRMKKQVMVARRSVEANEKKYMEAAQKNWDFPLPQVESIPEQIKELELIHSSYKVLETGWLENIIMVLFFCAVLMVTISTGDSLLALSSRNCEFLETFVDYDFITVVCKIALVLTCIAEEALAWFCWSNHNYKVDNLMLTVLLIAPVMYLILSVVLSGIVWIIIGVVSIVLVTVFIVFALAVLAAMAN